MRSVCPLRVDASRQTRQPLAECGLQGICAADCHRVEDSSLVPIWPYVVMDEPRIIAEVSRLTVSRLIHQLF